MTDERPVIRLGGAIGDSLRDDLSAHTDIGSDPQAGCVLFDGAVATPTADQVQQAIKDRQTLIVTSPPKTHLDLLARLGGVGLSDVGVVALTTDANGKHRVTTVPRTDPGSATATIASEGAPPQTVSVTALPEPTLGATAARLARRSSPGPRRVASPMVAMDESGGAVGLIPPAGATWGQTVPVTSTWNGGISHIPVGCPGAGTLQNLDSQVVSTFYVYWVNGGSTPYYVVVLRLDASLGVGEIVTDSSQGRGWAQYDAFVTVENASTSTGTVQLGSVSPTTGSSYAAVNATLDLQVLGTGGGNVSQGVQVQDGVQFTLTDWSVVTNQQSSSAGCSWQFYDSTNWNPVNDQAGAATAFSSGTVKPLTAIGTSTLSATMYTTWNITGGTPAVILSGDVLFSQDFYVLWEASSKWRWHSASPGCYAQPFKLDLAAITGQG